MNLNILFSVRAPVAARHTALDMAPTRKETEPLSGTAMRRRRSLRSKTQPIVRRTPVTRRVMLLSTPSAPARPVVVTKHSGQRWQVRALGSPHPLIAAAVSSDVNALFFK